MELLTHRILYRNPWLAELLEFAPEGSVLFKHLTLVDLELIFDERSCSGRSLVIQIDLRELIPKVDHHQTTLMNSGVIVSGYLIGLLRHKDVNYEHYDLANDLNLLLFEIDGIWLLEVELVTQFLQVLDHTQKLFVLVKDDDLELVLGNRVQNA